MLRGALLRAGCRPTPTNASYSSARRSLFGLSLKRKPPPQAAPQKPKVVLSQDDLFHPLSRSPFPALRARGEAVRSMAPCPVCLEEHGERTPVSYECPDCGWPTHASEDHWRSDRNHAKYCGRLREVNEDEHDLRSGRKIWEFELPGEQAYEAAVSFANWDTYWFTRDHPSIDNDRARRHLTKLLTYPTTVSSVLHEFSGLTTRNQRVTPEGARSLAALRMTLHQRPSEGDEESDARRLVRVFILGARAESSLPPHVWQQLPHLFPGCRFHLFFIGPQVALASSSSSSSGSASTNGSTTTGSGSAPTQTSEKPNTEGEKPSSTSSTPSSSTPTTYSPPTPSSISTSSTSRSLIPRSSEHIYGVPSSTTSFSPTLTLTSLRTTYSAIHNTLGPFDPYQDVFFAFSPGFGFPSPTSPGLTQGEAPGEWGGTIPMVLDTKCAFFATGFSPTDMERDVRSLDSASSSSSTSEQGAGEGGNGVKGEFDWVLTPGINPFGSEKWEVADFDPRVMVKVNWGVWGIRGKRREIEEVRRAEE